MFEDEASGKTLENFLKEKRLDARTYNDKVLQLFLFLCPPQATYRVQVRDKGQKLALELLKKNPPAILQVALHCPECGSLRISYPQMTRKFLLPTLFLHLGIIFRVIRHQAYCEDCHCVWSLPRKTEAAHPDEMAAGRGAH